jgi:hypothetical protein
MRKLFGGLASVLLCAGLTQAQTTLPVAETAGMVGAVRFGWEQFAPGLQSQEMRDRVIGIASDWSGDRVILGDRPIMGGPSFTILCEACRCVNTPTIMELQITWSGTGNPVHKILTSDSYLETHTTTFNPDRAYGTTQQFFNFNNPDSFGPVASDANGTILGSCHCSYTGTNCDDC